MPSALLERTAVSLGLPASPLGGGAEGASLNFTMQHQQQDEWCWAAVTVSVAVYFGDSSWSQCGLSNNFFGQALCCMYGDSGSCNQPFYLDQALQKVGHFRLFSVGPASLYQVQAEIVAGRPLGVRIEWASSHVGHFVAIDGCTSDSVEVQDPWTGGYTSVDYNTFLTAYAGSGDTGVWTHCYWVM
jgi:Papain-like cysteine protease AvrRpt2